MNKSTPVLVALNEFCWVTRVGLKELVIRRHSWVTLNSDRTGCRQKDVVVWIYYKICINAGQFFLNPSDDSKNSALKCTWHLKQLNILYKHDIYNSERMGHVNVSLTIDVVVVCHNHPSYTLQLSNAYSHTNIRLAAQQTDNKLVSNHFQSCLDTWRHLL